MKSLAVTLAKVIVAKGKLPRAEARIAKHGPWTNFGMVLATIYGPRLVMLWNMWEADRAQKKTRTLAVMPAREESEVVDPGQAVN